MMTAHLAGGDATALGLGIHDLPLPMQCRAKAFDHELGIGLGADASKVESFVERFDGEWAGMEQAIRAQRRKATPTLLMARDVAPAHRSLVGLTRIFDLLMGSEDAVAARSQQSRQGFAWNGLGCTSVQDRIVQQG